jgi:uncharacterized damage-inducible protein DinB
MSTSSLSLRELLDYSTAESLKWRDWLATQPPEILELPAGTGRTATVRQLIHHIVVVERRYADRIRDEPVTTYEDISNESIEALFGAFTDARRRLDEWVMNASDADLARQLEFTTLSAGTRVASARKIVVHALLHGIRHWAQIAMVVRQHGHPTVWFHDILMSDALT